MLLVKLSASASNPPFVVSLPPPPPAAVAVANLTRLRPAVVGSDVELELD